MGPQIRDPQGSLLSPQQRMASAADLLAMALALPLYRQGWTLCFQPGKKYLQRECFRMNHSKWSDNLPTKR